MLSQTHVSSCEQANTATELPSHILRILSHEFLRNYWCIFSVPRMKSILHPSVVVHLRCLSHQLPMMLW